MKLEIEIFEFLNSETLNFGIGKLETLKFEIENYETLNV